MRRLTTLDQAVQWLQLHVRGHLRIDSRRVQPGDGFIAWPGAATDGRRHVADALARGAVACLVEQDGVEAFGLGGEQVASYPQLKAATGPLAAAFYGDASRQLAVLAVTGTNGKTSTAWWLAQALSHLHQVAPMPCAMVGTLGIGQPPAPGGSGQQAVVPTGLTTPDPVQLQQALRHFVNGGVKACAIEASSIGLQEHRLAGTHIRTAIFTNFTQDHLDYHGSMANYWLAKRALFAWPGLRSAVINIDDAQGAALAKELQGNVNDLWTVSCRHAARLQATGLSYTVQGMQFTVVEGAEAHLLQTTLIGEYNVSNLLGVIAAMRTLGVSLAAAVEVCGRLSPVPGRMECVTEVGAPLVAVDYAHTPDALDQALQALRPLARQRGGQLWCVFGCGGDRDAGKRPLMGALAGQRADRVWVTSDNPRSEDAQSIIDQVLTGVGDLGSVQAQSQIDRALAIAQAVQAAAPADVLLVAGKGHEDYQEIAGVKCPFSDLVEVRQALAARAASAHMFTLEQAQAWLPGARLVGSP
ncbi:MAG: UDP-N-acetylmuramoylalanyl-D-glutamate--2,6-diaminopimelate ligase, partial [Pseudomonadota bacterium]